MHNRDLRRAVALVALANLAYFFVEFAMARHIGSVSLFADSVDFLEDAAVNLLVFVALAWSARRRAQVGMALAMLLLVPGIATAWTAWQKIAAPLAPEPTAAFAHRPGRPGGQRQLRAAADAFPRLQRQPDARRIPFGAQ